MTDTVEPTPAPNPKSVAARVPVKRKTAEHDPDKFLRTAKQVVVDNYNSHRDVGRSPEMTLDQVYIVWFSKTLSHWKAVVASATVRGFLWEVTCNGYKGEVYIDVYKKFSNEKVVLDQGEKDA